MKRIFSVSIFLLLSIFSISQELQFTHSYGITSGSGNGDAVRFTEYDEEYDRLLVGGIYVNQLNPDFDSNLLVDSDNASDAGQGFLAIYDGNDDFIDSYNVGTVINAARFISDTSFVVCGSYWFEADLDPRPNFEMLKIGSEFGNGFVGAYHINGEPLWVKTFETPSSSSLVYMNLYGDQIIMACDFGAGGFGSLTFEDETTNLEIDHLGGRMTIVFSFNFLGEYQWHNEFKVSDGIAYCTDFRIDDDLMTMLFKVGEGEMDLQMAGGPEVLSFEFDGNLLIAQYNLNDLSVEYYGRISSVDDQAGSDARSLDIGNNGEIVIASTASAGTLSFTSSNSIEEVEFSTNAWTSYIAKINHELGLSWITLTNSENVSSVEDIEIDQFGRIWIVGIHFENVYSDGVLLFEGNDSFRKAYMLQLSPNGVIENTHKFIHISGDFWRNLLTYEDNNIYYSGRYTGNHFFDLNEELSSIGSSLGGSNGFLAKYSLDSPTPTIYHHLFANSEMAFEGGSNAILEMNINSLITSNVDVVLTPNAELDLGNGSGIPITKSFFPEGNYSLVQEIVAVDDLAIEGNHEGQVTISVVSDDSNFNNVPDQTISVQIVDNDVISVDEVQGRSDVQIYPNPTSDFLEISFNRDLVIDEFQIYNMRGEMCKLVSPDIWELRIVTSDLSIGKYILKIISSNGIYSRPFIIQN